MLTNPRVAGYLSKALSHEMSVVQQYLTQACLCKLWGLPDQASYFRREATEEQEHAGKIICHMLTLNLAPNATRLAAARPGRDLAEMLVLDRRLELEAVYLYDEAMRHAQRFGDPASTRLFAELLADEQSHLNELDRLAAEFTAKEELHG